MLTFSCHCTNRLHFENTRCLACAKEVVYDPMGDQFLAIPDSGAEPCANRGLIACNWMRLPGTPYCASCAITARVPSLEVEKNIARLSALEQAKRRLLRTLVATGVWKADGTGPGEGGVPLIFEFLESLPGSPPVMTGHQNGVVTVNVAEADDVRREQSRERLGEPYRTLLGHLRHEVGHYYWDRFVKNGPAFGEFRRRFGDDREDYGAAMERYYREGPSPDWRLSHISAYATMHPWEDWAETWAHMMHRHDTLETAADAGILIDPGREGGKERYAYLVGIAGSNEEDADRFGRDSDRWLSVIVIANDLSRSMGQPDLYPFAPGIEAMAKIFFAERIAAGKFQPTEKRTAVSAPA